MTPGRPAAAGSRIVAERRIITVLAVDIVGSMRHIADCDPDDAQLFFDRCFDHMRKMIERAGGSLVSFEGDGGIAAFGWPSAHEDHADRACTAAWDIQHGRDAGVGPGGSPVRFRIGVHSGLVALRRVRRGSRVRPDTIGATVHIAAKLQQHAEPGGILVSAEAARLCRNRLDLALRPTPSVLDDVTANVFSLEVRPEGRRTSELEHRYRVPMIGRQSDLARLRKYLPRLRGQSVAIGIVGEPGIGKSRLAAAAVADALALDAKILVFFGDAQKRTTPFAAARSLIDDCLQPAASPGEARAALAAAGLDDTEIEAIHPLPAAAQGKRHDKQPRLTERQLARLFAKAFCALALDRPTLVLAEDLHLIDQESRDFLHILAGMETQQPLCLLLTGRPESLEAAREIAQSVLILEPLPKSAMAAICRQLWPNARLSRSTLDLLVTRADGIPFVLEELIHAFGDGPGRRPNALPQGIESFIHVRLQRLSPSARALAQALSLLGENVDVAFASAVIGRGADTLLADLAELERFAFVHPAQGGLTHMRHQIIAEACADTIPHDRRRQLHRAAIDAIVVQYPGLDGRYEQLAFHAERAGDLAAALDYLWEAALEARRSSATRSLNLIFDRAIDLIARIGDPAEKKYVDFVLMAFAAMLQLGEFEKMNTHLPRVMERARRFGEPALVCSTLSQFGMMCWFEGRYEESLRATEEGLDIARTLQSPALIFSNQLMLANALHGLGQAERAVAECRQLCALLTGELETARLGAPGLPSATALAFMSWFMVDTGAYVEGLDLVERGVAIAIRERDPYSEVLARHALGRNLLALNRNLEAVDCLRIAREISERNGYDAIKANLAGRMAIALSRTGRAAEAIEIVEQCLRKKLHLRTGRIELYSLHVGYGEALLRQGEVERGLAFLADALSIARAIGNPCLIANALGIRAWLLSERAPGDPAIAADLAERDEICGRHGLTPWPNVSAFRPISPEPGQIAQPSRS